MPENTRTLDLYQRRLISQTISIYAPCNPSPGDKYSGNLRPIKAEEGSETSCQWARRKHGLPPLPELLNEAPPFPSESDTYDKQCELCLQKFGGGLLGNLIATFMESSVTP